MPIFSVPDRVNKSGLCSFKEKSDVNTVVPVLAVSYSDIDPVIVASVAQHDVNLSLIDFCTPHKLFKTDDPELQKIIDLYKVSRNQLAVVGIMWKVIAHLNGYDSFMGYMNAVNARAGMDLQLNALRGMLESKKGSDSV